jgi:hypothetical protein
MRSIRLPAFLAILVFAGCWSIDSKAGNSRAETPSYGPSATPTPRGIPTMTTTPTIANAKKSGGFMDRLPADFEQPTDDAGRLLLREYGSLFVAGNGAIAPKKVVFKDDADVRAFQASAPQSTETIGGTSVTLQTPAMTALKAAIAEARSAGLAIGPRGADSAKRGYQQTVTLWASRVNPGFVYWVGKGRVTQAEAARIKAMSPFQQVPEILRLEQNGIYFAKDLSKSIIYSVAPPGTSQHLSMLALDVQQNENARVREILARHGWFQTVSSDLPHFTYLGVSEAELPGLGLKPVTNSGRTFWVPDL